MKELADIIALARTRRIAQAALATVVRIDGSAYRRPGASLLLDAEGRRLGSVSGGCLERDVESHAKAALASGQPRLITYDTRDDADVIFGTALGCGGLVEVFIERIDLLDDASPVARWSAAADRRETIAELLIIDAPSASPMSAGERAWFTLDDPRDAARKRAAPAGRAPASAAREVVGDAAVTADGTHVGGASDLVTALIAAGRDSIDARQSAPIAYAAPFGDVRAFVRVIEPPVRLIICGGGDDALPLVSMANSVGWRAWVLDHRSGFAKPERFPGAERVEVSIAGTLPSDFVADPRTVAIVMNHHYPSDGAWLRTLAATPLPYVGLLGARHRTARLLKDHNLPPAGPGGLEHLYAPAGLDIGGEGPEAIALAMLAEMQAVLAGRRGGLLRDSPRSIQPAARDAARDGARDAAVSPQRG